MIKIFIGVDRREMIAYHVLVQSLLAHSSVPLSITPLDRRTLGAVFSRPRGELDSTDFAVSRFIVPMLCDFRGMALFMDCDMIVCDDIAKLFEEIEGSDALRRSAVCVVKHDYVPSTKKKFLDQVQTAYPKKNWTSFMVFDNHRCHALTRTYVESAPGLELHQFRWIEEQAIGALDKRWNHLVGEENQCDIADAKVLHFTLGTPCFPEYARSARADEWYMAFMQALSPIEFNEE